MIRDTEIGLIGYGSIGKVHLQAVASVHDNTGLKISTVAEVKDVEVPDGINQTRDYSTLLQDPNIKAVAIATPPDTHFKIARGALQAKKDVLLEKPPTLTISELEKLSQIASQQKTVLFTAFHAMYRPEVQKACDELSKEEVVNIAIEYKEDVMHYHGADGWIFDIKRAGGGVLMDSGINAMSIVQRVLPDLEIQVEKSTLGHSDKIDVETSAHVEFGFGRNGKGYLSMDWMYKESEVRKVTFTTKSGVSYRVDIVQATLTRDKNTLVGEQDKSKTIVDLLSEYRGVYKDFARYISERKSYVSDKELKFVLDAYKVA